MNYSKSLIYIEIANLINKDKVVIKGDDDYNSRADKSLWRISLLGFWVSGDNTCQKQQSIDNDQVSGTDEDTTLESFKDKGCTKYDPLCTDSGQLYIKDFLLNKSINRNIDFIDANCENSSISCSSSILTPEQNYKEEFLEDKQGLSSSESFNNSAFLNDSFAGFACSQQQNSKVLKFIQPCSNKNPEVATGIIKDKSEQKEKLQELRHFYPLSEKDINMLNSRASREFSNNFVNQLLLKLYIKYPEKRFKNRFTFLSYMSYVLVNEKHQGPLVNHTNFRFSCNIGTEEKIILKYEQYLSEIESSFDTSKEMCVKKKIAGRFSTEVAYKILTKVEFKTNHDNSFITALIPHHIALSERQKEAISEQLEAVYGTNGYYIQELEQEKLPPNTTTQDTGSHDTALDIPAGNCVVHATNGSTAWQEIRKGLIEELGEVIDAAWFSKAVATEDKEQQTLMLTMPTKFMADWIKSNYSHVLRRLAGSVVMNSMEYCWNQNIELL